MSIKYFVLFAGLLAASFFDGSLAGVVEIEPVVRPLQKVQAFAAPSVLTVGTYAGSYNAHSIAHSVAAPVAAPFTAPVAAPFTAPVAAPFTAPVAAPFAAPVAAPVAGPVAAPFAYANSPYLVHYGFSG